MYFDILKASVKAPQYDYPNPASITDNLFDNWFWINVHKGQESNYIWAWDELEKMDVSQSDGGLTIVVERRSLEFKLSAISMVSKAMVATSWDLQNTRSSSTNTQVRNISDVNRPPFKTRADFMKTR